MMQNILVLSSAGFIGSHPVVSLVEQGWPLARRIRWNDGALAGCACFNLWHVVRETQITMKCPAGGEGCISGVC